MQQGVGECRLTHEEYQAVRDVIARDGLWWDEDEPPTRLSPSLIRRGWSIELADDVEPFVGVAEQLHGVKRLRMRHDAPLSIKAAAIAHTLGHEILGHRYEIDIIATAGVRVRFVNRGVHPARDRAAGAAAALLLIPDRFAHSGRSVAEIASWCGVPLSLVMRRLIETVIVEDDPPGILRIDRRGRSRLWHDEPPPLQLDGTD